MKTRVNLLISPKNLVLPFDNRMNSNFHAIKQNVQSFLQRSTTIYSFPYKQVLKINFIIIIDNFYCSYLNLDFTTDNFVLYISVNS